MNPEDNKIKPLAQQGQAAVDKAANATKEAIGSTQQTAGRVMDKVTDKVDDVRSQMKPTMDNISDTVTSAMEKARVALHDATDQMREQAQQASDAAIGYTKDEPIKAMLIAAATGAVLMAAVSVMVRSRD